MNSLIRRLRSQQNMTQERLAERLGTTVLTVSRWERGVTVPRRFFIERLCMILGCQEQDLGFTRQAQASVPPFLFDSSISMPPHLVGREAELRSLKEYFLSEKRRVISIHGLPGVGKTALAIAIVHDQQIRDAFAGGVLWASLGPYPDFPGLLSRWARLLGISDQHLADLYGMDEWIVAIQEAIGQRQMLLILDDVWNFSDAQTLLGIGGPNCASLLTTRFPRIAVADGNICPFPLSELSEEQSRVVFWGLAPEAIEREPTKVQQLVRAAGGLPLALTLLGNYLRGESYTTPFRRITAALELFSNGRLRFLLDPPSGNPGQVMQASLSARISESEARLSPGARSVLSALSVFPSKPERFSEEAALFVANCSTHELDELIDAGLLESDGECYCLHPVIADYARLQMDEQTEWFVRQRLLEYAYKVEDAEEEVPVSAFVEPRCVKRVSHFHHKEDSLWQQVCLHGHVTEMILCHGNSQDMRWLNRDKSASITVTGKLQFAMKQRMLRHVSAGHLVVPLRREHQPPFSQKPQQKQRSLAVYTFLRVLADRPDPASLGGPAPPASIRQMITEKERAMSHYDYPLKRQV